MKISGSPAERLPGRVSGTAGSDPRRNRRVAPQAEEERPAAAAHIEARHRRSGRNHLAVCDLIADRLAVDLQDQIALAQPRPVGAAAQIDAADADPSTMVAVVFGRILHREAERLLVPPESRRGWARLPGGARFLLQHHQGLLRLARTPEADADPLARRGSRGQPAQSIAL